MFIFFRTLVVHSLVRIDPPAINLLAGKSRYRERCVMVLRASCCRIAGADPTKAFRLDYRRKQTTTGKKIHITVTHRLVRPDIFIASSAPPLSVFPSCTQYQHIIIPDRVGWDRRVNLCVVAVNKYVSKYNFLRVRGKLHTDYMRHTRVRAFEQFWNIFIRIHSGRVSYFVHQFHTVQSQFRFTSWL